MNCTTIGVDLAKNVFEIAVAGPDWKIVERYRLNRAKFSTFFVRLDACRVVLEACGSAHHWARKITACGHHVQLLPAQYVRAYVKRNKTDRADAAALIEAARCGDILPVPIKTIEQQQIQALHRLRTQWIASRLRCINNLRGILREFGLDIAVGANVAKNQIGLCLADTDNDIPEGVRPALNEALAEVHALEEKIVGIERQLTALTRHDHTVRQLREIPGIGLLTGTALRASVCDIQRFPSGRHFASWLGLTARERSSAETRRLGGISKRGDVYLRTLLVHGARSALLAARRTEKSGKPLDRLRSWALDCERRTGHNKATVALANRLARIVWATWKYQRPFDGNFANRVA
jgi:transposase